MEVSEEEVDAMWKFMKAELFVSEIQTNGDRLWANIQKKMDEIIQSIRRNWSAGPPHQQLLELYTEIKAIDDHEIQTFVNRIKDNQSCINIWAGLLQQAKKKQVPKQKINGAVQECIKCFIRVWRDYSRRKKHKQLMKWKREGSFHLQVLWEEEVMKKFEQINYPSDKHEDATESPIQTAIEQLESILSVLKDDPNPVCQRWMQTICQNKKNLAIFTDLHKHIHNGTSTPLLINNAVREWIERVQILWLEYRKKRDSRLKLMKQAAYALAITSWDIPSLLCSVRDRMIPTAKDASLLCSVSKRTDVQQSVQSNQLAHQLAHQLAQPQRTSERKSAQKAAILCSAMLQRGTTRSLRSLKNHVNKQLDNAELDAELQEVGLKEFKSERKRLVFLRDKTCIVQPPGSKQKKRTKNGQKRVGHLYYPKTARQKKPVVLPRHNETSIKKQQELISEYQMLIENAPTSTEKH